MYLFAPVNYNEIGAGVIHLTQYGFMLKEFNYSEQSSQNIDSTIYIEIILGIIVLSIIIFFIYRKLR